MRAWSCRAGCERVCAQLRPTSATNQRPICLAPTSPCIHPLPRPLPLAAPRTRASALRRSSASWAPRTGCCRTHTTGRGARGTACAVLTRAGAGCAAQSAPCQQSTWASPKHAHGHHPRPQAVHQPGRLPVLQPAPPPQRALPRGHGRAHGRRPLQREVRGVGGGGVLAAGVPQLAAGQQAATTASDWSARLIPTPSLPRGPVRLHWGKAGWPDAGCWRGDEHYGINWCSFGCATLFAAAGADAALLLCVSDCLRSARSAQHYTAHS